MFDQNRQKREEISQFLEQNGAANISTISTGGGAASNNISTLQLRNLNQSSEMFNRTDMRIYQQLFPDRELKAQRFFDLNTTSPPQTLMMRSPSFSKKGATSNNISLHSNPHQVQPGMGGKPQQRSSSQRRNSNSQIRLNKPRNMSQLVEST